MIPRDYQFEAIDSLWDYFVAHEVGNPVVAAPTGTGKSVIIAGFLQRAFMAYARQRILVLTHVKELIEQNHEKLTRMWPTAPTGIYSAGLGFRDHISPIIFAGIASVVKKAALFGWIDLLIIDEAHLVSPAAGTMYRLFIEELKAVNPRLRVIGLTATAYRLGHGKLTDEGGLFTDVCCDLTTMACFNRFISEGYLSMLIPKRTSTIIDTSSVHMRGGEFISKELQLASDKEAITKAAVEEAVHDASDRNCWLVFTSGIQHAEHVTQELEYKGIEARCVHSKMKPEQRDDAINDLRCGNIQALVNYNILTTGFDLDTIDYIMSLRATASPGLWVQMLGRGTRPCYADGFDLSSIEGRLASMAAGPKQNCLVSDFAGNTQRLGPINDPVIPKKRGKKGGVPPIKTCDKCSTMNHISVRFCIFCGAEFHFEVKIKQTASTAELIRQAPKLPDPPQTEIYDVDVITYSVHKKKDRPDSMKVQYYCDLRMFTEYICLAHTGSAWSRAQRWWKARTVTPPPFTAQDAVACAANVLVPATHLKVIVNRKYPDIVAHCLDGSRFGQVEPDVTRRNDIQVSTVYNKPTPAMPVPSFVADIPFDAPGKKVNFDDDIPF